MKKIIVFLVLISVALLCFSSSFDGMGELENSLNIPEPKLIEKGELIVIGFQKAIKQKDATIQIQRLWKKFMKKQNDIQYAVQNRIYLGVSFDREFNKKENDYEYKHLVGMLVKSAENIPPKMTERIIPAQKYLVFTHYGSLDLIGDTYNYIFGEWIPNKDYKIAEADMFEWYDEHFKTDSEDSQIDIYIPIE